MTMTSGPYRTAPKVEQPSPLELEALKLATDIGRLKRFELIGRLGYHFPLYRVYNISGVVNFLKKRGYQHKIKGSHNYGDGFGFGKEGECLNYYVRGNAVVLITRKASCSGSLGLESALNKWCFDLKPHEKGIREGISGVSGRKYSIQNNIYFCLSNEEIKKILKRRLFGYSQEEVKNLCGLVQENARKTATLINEIKLRWKNWEQILQENQQ